MHRILPPPNTVRLPAAAGLHAPEQERIPMLTKGAWPRFDRFITRWYGHVAIMALHK